MVTYLMVDTCVLSEILKQYEPLNPRASFKQEGNLSRKILDKLNAVVSNVNKDGYIIASTFAFIELLNKFDIIFKDSNVTLERLNSFITQPPEWFIVEKLNIDSVKSFCQVPLRTPGPPQEAISSDDAVHIATAIQRGDKMQFLTSDHKLLKLQIKNITFIG